MKYFVLVFAILAILFSLSPIEACESTCRKGVASGFATAYTKEIKPFFNAFSNNLIKNLYKNVDLKSITGSTSKANGIKTVINNAVKSAISKFQKDFSGNFSKLIQDSIFVQEPKFKGDCSKPFRINQTKTLPWDPSSCEKMDYICGNPPSICHFLNSEVKPRCVENVKNDLKRKSTDFKKILTNTINDTARKNGIGGNKLKKLVSDCKKNVQTQLKSFINDFSTKFCKNNNCEQYDEAIKKEILSWP
ncbi:unnamed protein product [Rhizophagus irregularis]|uniref:Uncharacterized protein n=1 Tax=Rhizophagus irregularis TaxID=588596 RepID=A0A2N1NMP6_9GLOM|nr:hypothetical protein RhiirC2_818836 [Rhizophagus irregularis]CAB4373949.1 unnamed protein product [Rhizophagus irregularis]CAB5382373.1 unnamed protein product [Rhizophagus irregularis]